MDNNQKETKTYAAKVRPMTWQLFYSFAIFLALAIAAISVRAQEAGKEYEIFDGHTYNGKFYPRIDILEWTDDGESASHMEFQNYNKEVPVDMSFQLDEKSGKKVMLVRYTIKDRNEVLCRRVLAPQHFKGDKFFIYSKVESDRDLIFVSMYPLPDEKGRVLLNKPVQYSSCEMPSKDRMPASDKPKKGEGVTDQKRVPVENGAIKGKGDSVPFDF